MTHHGASNRTVLLAGVIAPLAVFAVLAVVVRLPEVGAFDRGALRAVEHLHAEAATVFVRGLTFFGDYWGSAILTAVAVIVLTLLRRRREAVFMACVMVGSGVLQYVVKLVFERPRPSVFPPLAVETSYSFPSGHAMSSATLALALAIVCWRTCWRWWAVVGGSLFALAMSFTRPYLGVHYPSDLPAGWCLAVAWTALVWLAFCVAGRRPLRGRLAGSSGPP